MENIMAVLVNGVAQLEYDRNKLLPGHQELYLEKMDKKMAAGISLGNVFIDSPDISERTQFVSANLAHAIKIGDESTAAALCSYLAIRLPDLKQVKINDKEQGVIIDLVYDEEYSNQVPVQFNMLH
ncbi:MAG: hypothetical protein OQK73_07700 [Gammaproteobacteria bacterium]|nr:hypothetical protein [Gammaproteobacteria bacterium]